MRLPLLITALAALSVPAMGQGRGAFTVTETGRSFGSLADALASLDGGDGTIRIAPGTYSECAVQESGHVAFVAAQPGKVIFDSAICEGKATLVLRGEAAHVEGIVFTHVFVEDGNGAGIRLEKGDLSVANAMFVDSQSGILSGADPSGSVTIDHSSFAGLGKDPTGNGAHAVYIGNYGSLKVANCRFERGTGGHYVKSRAARIEVRDSSFDDSHGQHTNYMIDLPNGASGIIAGNSFLAGPGKDNYSTMITVAPEGQKHSAAGLTVENNRAWLAPGIDWSTTLVGNWSGDRVTVRNNQLTGRIAEYAKRT